MDIKLTQVPGLTQDEQDTHLVKRYLRGHPGSALARIAKEVGLELERTDILLNCLLESKAITRVMGSERWFDAAKVWLYSMAPKDPKHYYGAGGEPYEWPHHRGYLALDVLPFLVGHKMDEVAMGFIHSLRPSSVRVVQRGQHCDHRSWRVTVNVDSEDNITSIVQECEVGLPKGVAHGSALRSALTYGVDSPQVKWHDLDGPEYYCDGQHYKVVDGKRVYYPK